MPVVVHGQDDGHITGFQQDLVVLLHARRTSPLGSVTIALGCRKPSKHRLKTVVGSRKLNLTEREGRGQDSDPETRQQENSQQAVKDCP